MMAAADPSDELLGILGSRREFGLRTSPFTPSLQEDGRQLRFAYGAGPLNPYQKDSSYHLRYYFDFYDWMDRGAIAVIQENGRLRVFARPRSDQPMVVLISGFRGTGRTSVKNLLLYEIATRTRGVPVVTEFKISMTAQRAQDAANLANTFVKNFEGRPNTGNVKKALQETIKGWRENLLGDDPNMEFLFQSLRNDVDAAIPDTTTVFCLDASSYSASPDMWRQTCKAVSLLADFVILFISDRNQANFSKSNLLRNNFQVAWIDAPTVDRAKMAHFLAKRLRDERVASQQRVASELAPFTPDALDALFSATDGTAPRPVVRLPISFALDTLKRAFNQKCQQLAGCLAELGGDVQKVDPTLLWITEADMREAMKR